MKKERRDVVKSRSAIKQAYVSLCMGRTDGRITVANVLDEANVSRGTFYAHFQSLDDVRRCVEDDLLATCKELMAETDVARIARDPFPQIMRVVTFFYDHADTIRNISANSNRSFISRYKSILVQGIVESPHTIADDTTAAVLDACVVGAIVDGCLEAILLDRPCSAEDVARTISSFVSNGIAGLSQRGR